MPSDILTMPHVFIPLVQLPDDAGTEDDRPHIPGHNADLRQAHERLVHVAAHITRHEPATIFDQTERLADREHANDLNDEVPSALHEYAATAIFTFGILTKGRTGPPPR